MFGALTTSSRATYFLTVIDDFSRIVWVFLLTTKFVVSSLLENFCAMTITQFGKQVQRVRADNGTEFLPLTPYFANHGILFETTCPYTPRQNARVERKHRHLLNVARALRFQAHLSLSFWGECVMTAC